MSVICEKTIETISPSPRTRFCGQKGFLVEFGQARAESGGFAVLIPRNRIDLSISEVILIAEAHIQVEIPVNPPQVVDIGPVPPGAVPFLVAVRWRFGEMLGGAGQRILTAGEILCLAGASAGLHAAQKNDYPITVMRGHSMNLSSSGSSSTICRSGVFAVNTT